MCPYCSKLCCKECIEKWLLEEDKNECPHCRSILRI